MLDYVLPKLIKAGRGVLTGDIIEDEPQQEDSPPEPYNEADACDMERPYDKPSCKEIENERPICDHTGKSANRDSISQKRPIIHDCRKNM